MSERNENRPRYKKTKVGWIPEEWECVRLDSLASVKTGPFGAQLHEEDYVEHGTPIITVEHLSEYGIVHRNLPKVSDADKKRLSQYILVQPGILFSAESALWIETRWFLNVRMGGFFQVVCFEFVFSTEIAYHNSLAYIYIWRRHSTTFGELQLAGLWHA